MTDIIQMAEEKRLRAARRKHLRPLTKKTVGEIIVHIDSLHAHQLKALERAMNSCSTTNCGWDEYEIAKRFIGDVRVQILRKSRSRNVRVERTTMVLHLRRRNGPQERKLPEGTRGGIEGARTRSGLQHGAFGY